MTGLATNSSSISYQWTYDIFINFRGEDTRHGFTGNLYQSLCQKGVRTFLDDKELKRGDEITPAILKAIENSRMAVTVFSKNYASSTFCLNELVKIHEFIKRKDRLVLPIFYDVEPSEVRHQKKNYGQALSMHIRNLKADEDKIQSWKLALHEVSNISGFHFNPRNGYEYQFIERIVREVSSKINRVPLHVATYPIGLESQVLAINSILQIGSTEVIMVGICGIGGMGKTTIARAVYNSVADNFENMCFYHDIKDDCRKFGLEQIQETILSRIVGVHIKIQDVNEGVEVIKMRLKQKKILLVLDNIYNHEQLKRLAGDCNWFGGGSRIIITTRDKHLLVRHGVESIYNMNSLNAKESLQLLSCNAFRNLQVNPSYMEVLNRAVIYAQGLPLALEVIGSNLCGRTIDEWESMLDAYKLIPNKVIQQVLKMSYEGLEEVEKEIFLDIACYFKGKYLKDVKYMEEVVHGFNNLSYFIRVLVDKCLIKIENGNCIEMHDLIRDMGREIVREESPNKPGKRSRLWFHQDIVDVLEGNKGTDDVKMIIQENVSKCIEVNWDGEAFKSMKELKILIFEDVKFSESPKYLPNSLKVLKWRRYPFSCLPPNFCPKKLVVLDIGDSYLNSLEPVKTSHNLGILNLRGCQYVTEICNLSDSRNLKELNVSGCKNLIEMHDSIAYLAKLEILDAEGCVRLKTFPRGIKLPSLRGLNLNHCSSLKYFPEVLEKVKISHLSLVGTRIEKLPWSICNLSELKTLRIKHHKSVIEIPNSIFLLPELRDIDFDGGDGKVMISSNSKEAQQQAICPKNCYPYGLISFLHLPRCNMSDDLLRTYLSRFTNVAILDLRGNNFTILPPWMKECHYLAKLILNECKNLREVEGIPPNIRHLEAINCMSLSLEAKSLLLSEELHGVPCRSHFHTGGKYMGEMFFWVPSRSIPKWFAHRSKGASISFWFRNSLPLPLCLCLLVKPTNGVRHKKYSYDIRLLINRADYGNRDLSFKEAVNVDDHHLIVYNLTENSVPSYKKKHWWGNRWHYAQVLCKYYSTYDDPVDIEESGIYVIRQLCEMQHISFINPYSNPAVRGLYDMWTMKEYEGPLIKRRLMRGDKFSLSRFATICTKEGRNSSINEDDNDAISPYIPFANDNEIINNQEVSLRNHDLNATSLPMLPWPEHVCDSFTNQGRSIEDGKELSMHPCWDTPFYDESASHLEYLQQENVTSTNVEQVLENFEDSKRAKGKEIVIYIDNEHK